MDEYIEREILLDHSEEILNALKNIEKSRSIGKRAKLEGARISAIASLIGIMKETPTADVAPVVHARWISREVDYCCPRCGAQTAYKTKFCYECGAKMDLEEP